MKTLIGVLAALFALASQASDIRVTKITGILVGPAYGDKVFLTINPIPDDRVACNTNNEYTYVFNASTESGKIYLSVALAAHMAGKNVWLKGDDYCSIHTTVENLAHIVTSN